MSRVAHERILLVGDATRELQGALSEAMPGAHVTSVGTYFDAIAEITAHPYTTVLAAAEPIERRPEAAVKSLRQAAGEARVLLFGQPSLEPVSRKMLSFGCDDYVITPTTPAELHQVFGTPPLRIAPGAAADGASDVRSEPLVSSPPGNVALLMGLPLAEILLDAMLQHPHDTAVNAVKRINERIGPTMRLDYRRDPSEPPSSPDGSLTLCHAVRVNNEDVASLCLLLPRDGEGSREESAGRHFLAQLAHLMGKIASLEDRHTRLQKLAITDELTGLYNGRYFRHFLTRIIDKARTMRFPVTLLLFDIDNFKKYNDQYGHGVGDEILRQTAALMRRCCRDHDLVARISGDEFAVVFWEKEGPRQRLVPSGAEGPRDGKVVASPGRPPQSVMVILDRFRRLLSLPDFSNLGKTGKGTLTISGGLAVFPYDAGDVDALIDAADRALMFGAKQDGKNSISLVGYDEPPAT
ncbi:MAG: GGDEF domain-containing protein [Planctomycetota bacterium]|nr:GGDEF domain-containing protein [Planctomycetota bacterium]